MIPLIEREVVDKKKWISADDMADILAISQSFPGAVAINSSTIIGYRVGGLSGAAVATLGVVIPSFTILTLIGAAFIFVMETGVVLAALRGIGAAVVPLLLAAALRVGKSAIKGAVSILVAIGALLLILWADIHPIYAIISGMAVGLMTYAVNLLKRKRK